MKKVEIEIKMVVLLIPSFILICVESWWSPLVAAFGLLWRGRLRNAGAVGG